MNKAISTYCFCGYSDILTHRGIFGNCIIKLYNDRLEVYSLFRLKLKLFYKDIVDIKYSFWKGITLYTSRDEYDISVSFRSKRFCNELRELIKYCG